MYSSLRGVIGRSVNTTVADVTAHASDQDNAPLNIGTMHLVCDRTGHEEAANDINIDDLTEYGGLIAARITLS
jgi:hypothetical protein